jgi:D-alanine transaminase/branched-chain amino acid aminotransferase
MSLAYLNGTFMPYADCRLHVSDLQLQRGYGVFDFFRVRKGEIPYLEDYTGRLFTSMEFSGMDQPFSKAEFHRIIGELQGKNEQDFAGVEHAFKVLVTGGFSENLASVSGPPNVLILQVPWAPPPPSLKEEGLRLVTDRFQRPNPQVKSMYYFNSLRLARRIKEEGALEVLYHTDLFSECSRSSVFFVKGGKVFSTRQHILDGITRKQLMKRFPEIGERDVHTHELFDVDELFITSTSMDVAPVVAVDGKPIGKGVPGPVTRELQHAFG